MAHQHRDEDGFDKTFPNYVVVDGVPAGVPAAKVTKLRTVLGKTFSKAANVKDIEIPNAADGTTLGYARYHPSNLLPVRICLPLTYLIVSPPRFAFVELSSPEEADKFVKEIDGLAFDAQHTFRVNHWSDFALQDSLPATYAPPQQSDDGETQVRSLIGSIADEVPQMIFGFFQKSAFLRLRSSMTTSDLDLWYFVINSSSTSKIGSSIPLAMTSSLL